MTYRGKTIADILEMTIEDAVSFFEAHPKILRMAECLRDVGLGYLTLVSGHHPFGRRSAAGEIGG